MKSLKYTVDELIPSVHMRNVLKANNFELTNFNKATLIWNMWDECWEDKIRMLEEFAQLTTDDVLRQQIKERIAQSCWEFPMPRYLALMTVVFIILSMKKRIAIRLLRCL